MKRETILKLIEEELTKLNKEKGTYLYDTGYVSGLIDMAYMTGLIDKSEKNMLKEKQHNEQ